jgi:hypothetical protein
MRENVFEQLVVEIGTLIVNDTKYAMDTWGAVALVGDLSRSKTAMKGYVYYPDGKFRARTPSGETLQKIHKLLEEMKKVKINDNREWYQYLIHITKPDFKINIDFEYEDQDRWSLKKISRSLSEYAEFLRPPMS